MFRLGYGLVHARSLHLINYHGGAHEKSAEFHRRRKQEGGVHGWRSESSHLVWKRMRRHLQIKRVRRALCQSDLPNQKSVRIRAVGDGMGATGETDECCVYSVENRRRSGNGVG